MITKKFKIGERVKVSRVKPEDGEGYFDDQYPKMGWRGTIIEQYKTSQVGHRKCVISWDVESPCGGDLVYNWQIQSLDREWDEEDNI